MAGYTRNLLTTLTVTNLQSNASSATNMWCSGAITFSANTVGIWVYVKLTHAATSPANSKGSFVYFLPSADGTNYADPATGTEGDQTIADITTTVTPNMVRFIPYPSSAATTEDVFWVPFEAGAVPVKACIGIVDHSGAAYSTGCVVTVEEVIAA